MGLNRLGVIWFLANGVRVQDVAVAHTVVAGSNMAATPLKLPCFIASVGTELTKVLPTIWRVSSMSPK